MDNNNNIDERVDELIEEVEETITPDSVETDETQP